MLLGTSLLSLILSLLLFFRNENRNSNFLAAFLLILSIFNLAHYYSAVEFNPFWSAFFYNHFAPLYLLQGPFILFYVRGIIKDDFVFRRLDWLHFIPALILLLAIGDYYFLPYEEKMNMLASIQNDIKTFNNFQFNKLFSHALGYGLRGVHITLYLCFSLYFLLFRLVPTNEIFSKWMSRSVFINWLILLHIILITIVLCYGIFTYFFIQSPEFIFSATSKIILNISGFGVVLLNGTLFFYPSILYGNIQIIKWKKNKKPSQELETDKRVAKQKPTKRTILKDEEKEEYFQSLKISIENLVDENQFNIQIDFSINDIAKALTVPPHHIRICFKDYIQEGLVDFRNNKRLEKAVKLLEQLDKLNLTIESVGELAGFSSRSSFFSVFKQKNNCTPQEYLNTLKGKSL